MTNWLRELLSRSEGASTKRLAYMMVVIATIIWLSFEQHAHAFSPAWVDVFKALLWIVGTVNLGGKAIDVIPTTKKPEKEGE